MKELTNNKKQFFEIAQKLVNFNKISHAYLIEIGDYDQDIPYVLDFIKMILCPNKKFSFNSNCSECNICELIQSGNYPDLMIVEPDGQWIKKNQLLALQSEYQNKSLLGNKRIYIIKNADRFNASSANTILKFLEEPEDDIIAILLTTNRYHVIETILSRCQILTLANTEDVDFEIDDNLFQLMKFIVQKDQLFICYNEIVENILPDKGVAKEKFSQVSSILLSYLDFLSGKVDFFGEQLLSILSNLDMDKILDIVALIEEEVRKLEYNVNYKLWLDALFAKLIGGGCND